MASMTIRNIPEDAKRRFRQLAAANGRSMEEHMRRLLLEAVADEPGPSTGVAEEHSGYVPPPKSARPAPAPDGDWVHELIRIANGAGEGVFDREPQPLREFDL